MMGAYGGGGFILFGLIYIIVIVFMIWLTYRFVKAHEKIADGIYEIKDHLRKMNNQNPL